MYNNEPNVVPHRFWVIGKGALVGHSDWIIRNQRVTLHFGPRTRYGYPQKVGWQLLQPRQAPVALYGWNILTRQRIWFGIPYGRASSGHVIAWPSGLVRKHFVHNSRAPSLLFVPSAGCYMLRAKWNTGSWSMPFAAGCLADRRMAGVASCR